MTMHCYVKGPECPECGGTAYYKKSGKCKGCVNVQRMYNMEHFRVSNREREKPDDGYVAKLMLGVDYQQERHTR